MFFRMMKRIKSTYICTIDGYFIFVIRIYAQPRMQKILMTKIKEEKNTEFNLYTGMFDFSDDGKRSNLFGIEHQNEELFRNTFLGKLSPITGGFYYRSWSNLFIYWCAS